MFKKVLLGTDIRHNPWVAKNRTDNAETYECTMANGVQANAIPWHQVSELKNVARRSNISNSLKGRFYRGNSF